MIVSELQECLNKNPLSLLYFSTPNCNVCKVLRPKVEAFIAVESDWKFQYINTEDSLEIAGQYLVFAVPTLLLMVEGREAGRFSRHFSMGELESQIQRYSHLYQGR